MDNKEVIPCIFYFYIHCKLKEKYKAGAIISKKEATDFLFEWRIPTKIRYIIVKELEMLGLLERVNKKTVEIKQSKFDLEDVRDFSKSVGIL